MSRKDAARADHSKVGWIGDVHTGKEPVAAFRSRRKEVNVIEYVEGVERYVHLYALGNRGLLAQAHIRVPIAEPVEHFSQPRMALREIR